MYLRVISCTIEMAQFSSDQQNLTTAGVDSAPHAVVGSKVLRNGKVRLRVTSDENGQTQGQLLQSNVCGAPVQSAAKKQKAKGRNGCMLGNANKCNGYTTGIDDTFNGQGQLKFRHSKACRESVESRERSVRLVES